MTDVPAQFSSKRKVFIFGDPSSSLVAAQLALFKQEAGGVAERNIEIKLVNGEAKWYRQYQVERASAFVLLLIGKDGSEKFRAEKLTQPEELFALIDTMPMRQAEMRRSNQRRE